MFSTENSVIIIGAGLSGLTAADEILKTHPGCKVTVLQSMNAPGGRTRSVSVNGVRYDLGAQWVGPPQKFVQELAKRANHEMVDQNAVGKKIVQIGENIQSYHAELPQNFGKGQEKQLEEVIDKIQGMAKTVPLDFPKNCPNSIQWDSMTTHSWIQFNIRHEKVKKFLQLLVRSIYGCQTNQVSFLFFLLYVHQNHGLSCMMNTKEGLQAYKFTHGSQGLSYYLQKQIKNKGGQIFYNCFVNKVSQTQKDVTVQTRKGMTFKAKYLIIAAPPQATKRIHFQPQLSRQRRFISDRFIMAAFSKVIIQYDRRYWVERGYSGEILSDCNDSPVLNAYDESKINEKGQIQPAIVVLVAASVDEQWDRNREDLKRRTIQKLAHFFGSPEMLKPKNVIFKIWNEEQTLGGAPTAYTPPGVLTKIQNIREPEGRIHWAGTQTALVSQGYMDGAIQSGIRVSKEILQRFKTKQPIKKRTLKPEPLRYTQYHISSNTMYSRL